ncbi:hypothetical protein C0V77_00635 [Emticicia sp. TH156]|nr:hypothetical protein C0V77_00635 [Emticicia sp. TH156]
MAFTGIFSRNGDRQKQAGFFAHLNAYRKRSRKRNRYILLKLFQNVFVKYKIYINILLIIIWLKYF